MITKIIDNNSISCIPEDSDDLIILRRIIKRGDRIVGETVRVIKQEKDFARPDKGERIKIRLSLEVEKISLDNVLDRMRVSGIIKESNNESIPHGSHHSFIIKVDQPFILIAIDTNDCGIGKLKGTHLHLLQNIYSGSSGKRYKTNFKIENFFDEISKALLSVVRTDNQIIIFGPGETKNRFANFLAKTQIGQNHEIKIVEGIDSGGEDGIHIFTKSKSMKEIISNSKLAKVSDIIDQVMFLANKKSRKFTMGFEETKNANQYGAIDSLIFSEKVMQSYDEQEVIDFLNDVESKGSSIYSVDTTTDAGLRVTGLGGIISILRFPVEG
ncbi:MAG TPA: mRNA surveillance protein Pelota [Candidatus Nitrosopelagicus sp.]|nr:mRNA surveillance protein Pelota [Candidatus Nitrosopelagicus sp.]